MFQESSRTAPWVVCEFGGASVATAADWQSIHKITEQRLEQGMHPLLVCSALEGVKESLERSISLAEAGTNWLPEMDSISDLHEALAADVGLSANEHIDAHLDELGQALADVRQHGNLPRLRARVLAQGELMATRLGAAILQAQGLAMSWRDARQMMTALSAEHEGEDHFLRARISSKPDPELQARLNGDSSVLITQGQIARGKLGETVLLERDIDEPPAVCLASRLQAKRLEIWSDEPGVIEKPALCLDDALPWAPAA